MIMSLFSFFSNFNNNNKTVSGLGRSWDIVYHYFLYHNTALPTSTQVQLYSHKQNNPSPPSSPFNPKETLRRLMGP